MCQPFIDEWLILSGDPEVQGLPRPKQGADVDLYDGSLSGFDDIIGHEAINSRFPDAPSTKNLKVKIRRLIGPSNEKPRGVKSSSGRVGLSEMLQIVDFAAQLVDGRFGVLAEDA